MLLPLALVLALAPAPAEAGPETRAPGIAPGRLAPPPSTIRLVGGHRLVEQADGSWSCIERAHGFVAHVSLDGQLSFDNATTHARPAHPWMVQARDPITGQPTGQITSPVSPNPGSGAGGNALGALLTAGLFKGLELRSQRRHDRPSADEPLDPRDRFALDTAQFRAELASAWYEARLQESLTQLDGRLRALWSDAIKPKTRRLAVFELWLRFPDSLPETPLHPPPAVRERLDARRTEAGERGRELVLEFVRDYLPRASSEGYSRTELRRLNEGRSFERFEPYAATPP